MLRTGDIGRFDDDGFLVLMDRRKDMVISGGFNIYPSGLAAVLRQHPDVADAAVVVLPSREWGETPAAFCVRRPGSTREAGAAARAACVGRFGALSCLQPGRILANNPHAGRGSTQRAR